MPESKDTINTENITDVEFTEEKTVSLSEEEAKKKSEKEAEEKAKKEAEEKAKREAEEKAKREAEEKAKNEAKREAEEKAKKEADGKDGKDGKEADGKDGKEADSKDAKEADSKDGKNGKTGSFNFVKDEPEMLPTKNKSSDLLEQVQITALKNRYMEMEAQESGHYSPFSVMNYDNIKEGKDKDGLYVIAEMQPSHAKIYNRPDRIDLHYNTGFHEAANGKRTQVSSQLSFDDCMALVRMGMEKGWTATTLSGPPEFKEQMYLACRALGMKVEGYTANPELEKQGDAKWKEYAVARDHAKSMDQRFPRLEDERQAANLGYDGISQEFVKDLKSKDLGYDAPTAEDVLKK